MWSFPQLLTRDPTRRLGSGKADAEDIKRHPFFKDVSFDDVLNKRIPPPYFPTIVRRPLLLVSLEPCLTRYGEFVEWKC